MAVQGSGMLLRLHFSSHVTPNATSWRSSPEQCSAKPHPTGQQQVSGLRRNNSAQKASGCYWSMVNGGIEVECKDGWQGQSPSAEPSSSTAPTSFTGPDADDSGIRDGFKQSTLKDAWSLLGASSSSHA